jgi:hypothetical protein
MQLSLGEKKILRGKILQILAADYPHHIERDILDATLQQRNFYKGPEATLREIVFLKQKGFLTWETNPDDNQPGMLVYQYCLTAEGYKLASGDMQDDDVHWFGA